MTAPALRPYQTDVVGRTSQIMRESKSARPVIAMPTGSGKTIVAAHIAGAYAAGNRRVVFAVDREVLVEQTARQFSAAGLPVDVYAGGYKRGDNLVQVVSQQAIAARGGMPDADILLVDEAHIIHGALLAQINDRPDMRVIGLSASPWTETAVTSHTDLIVGPTMADLMAPPDGSVPSLARLAEIRTAQASAGDMSDREADNDATAERAMVKLRGDIAREWLAACLERYGAVMPTLIFPVTVAHAEALAAEWAAIGYRCEVLTGLTPKTERREIFGRLQSGKTTAVASVGVLGVGFDFPPATVAVIARPVATESTWLLVQMIGRVLRPHRNKDQHGALVMEHGRNMDRHGDALRDLIANGPAALWDAARERIVKQAQAKADRAPALAETGPAREIATDRGAVMVGFDLSPAGRAAEAAEATERALFLGELWAYWDQRAKGAKGIKPLPVAWVGYRWRDRYGDTPMPPRQLRQTVTDIRPETMDWVREKAHRAQKARWLAQRKTPPGMQHGGV